MTEQLIQKKRGFINRRLGWIMICCLGVIAIAGYATINNNFQDDPFSDQSTYQVKRGPLTISVTVGGTIQAKEKLIIKSELEGQSTILYIVPEGSEVKEGDLLVELDASSLIDQKVEQEIKVQNAEASYINARENKAIVESLAKSDIDQAELDFFFAKQDLEKYTKGDYLQAKSDAIANIAEIQESLNIAEEDVRWSRILNKEKYLADSTLKSEELTVFRLKNNLDSAKTAFDVLEKYASKRQFAQLESDVTQAEMALDRTKRQANANTVQAAAELQAKLSEFNQQKSKLVKMGDQIGKAKIYAKMDGLAVYATSVRMSFRGNQEPLEEGQSVRERQELIHLPTTSSFIAEVKVQESQLDKIRLGLPVRITVNAVPGKVYTGKVTSIAPLANAQSIFMNPDLKVYDTQITLDGTGDDLISGMGCEAEIVVDHFDDTTYVPIQTVIRVGGIPTVYVATANKWEARTVDLGRDNNSLAQIKSGLKKDEIVWMTPPLSAGQLSNEDRFKDAGDLTQILKDAQKDQSMNPSRQQPGPNMSRLFQGQSNQQRPPQSPGVGEQGQGDRSRGGPGGRQGQGSMTPEQREEMRKRFENMSEEDRSAMRNRSQQNRGDSSRQGGRRQQ